MSDPSSFSTPAELRVTHSDLALRLLFSERRIEGVALLKVAVARAGSRQLVLDTSCSLAVSAAWLVEARTARGAALPFALAEETAPLGAPLSVTLPEGLAEGATVRVGIAFSTSPSCSAAQWLEPAQTAGGVHPYVFTQCQAIHARSLIPCQDSPGCKMSYSASVWVPAPLTALMSALRMDAPNVALQAAAAQLPPGPAEELCAFHFRQPIPIPPYLLALAAGELVSAGLSDRSCVWSEPSTVAAGAYEFADTAAFLSAAEDVAGPYVWGRYDLLLLPPSFPYGGMENPCLTFVTPTLLAGDRSLANVVAHEIAHSWTGNLLTNASWESFWLNEGCTVFIERKILGRMHGAPTWALHAGQGWSALKAEVSRIGETHPYTCLVQDLSGGKDPDDAFSRIPYEKGFALLVSLERLVGGPTVFEPFFRTWLAAFAFKSAHSDDFVAHCRAAFPALQFDWQTWLHAPGMPPVDLGATYDGSLRSAADALAMRWHVADVLRLGALPADASQADVAGWSSEQTLVFLERLAELAASSPLQVASLRHMDRLYRLSGWRNAELRCAWLRLRLDGGDPDALAPTAEFLGEQGRMKFLRPLYRAMKRNAKAYQGAEVAIFEQRRAAYHPIAAKMVAADLGV